MTKNPFGRKSIGHYLDKLIERNFRSIIFVLIGLILVGFGAFIVKDKGNISPEKIEVLEDVSESQTQKEIVVEIAGAIETPGVYVFEESVGVEDLLIKANGLSANADRNWIEKHLNRAAKLIDGQKIYIP